MSDEEPSLGKRQFLSDAIVYESFKLGKLNLITAPCGAGKTTAAFKTIPEYLNVQPCRSLILINTVAGADEFVADDLAYYYDYDGKEWDSTFSLKYDKPTVMTYALFGAQYKKGNISLEDYDYIVCDELHVLNKYIAMARGKLSRQYPQAAPWEINDMLQITCFTYIAVEAIETAVLKEKSWVFALTATPEQLYRGYLRQLSIMINEVQYSQVLHAYEIFCKYDYTQIEPILRAVLPENRKRLFYFNTIKELQQYKQILIECGRKAEAIWSLTAATPMSEHARTTRDYLLSDHRLPSDVQDLLINGAYETAISIKDPLVKEAYIHTGNSDTRIQARNRLRQDLEVVGYYSKPQSKDERRTAKEKQQVLDSVSRIPADYFNRPLSTEDKEQLITLIQCPKKWISLKKALVSLGYTISEKKVGTKHYSIIVPQNNQP